MTDIVERLREKMTRDEFFKVANNLCFEAASEIERLRLSLSEARAIGKREGMEEAALYHDDLAEQHAAARKEHESGHHMLMERQHRRDAAAIRAAMEK